MEICSYFLFCVVISNFSRLLALKCGVEEDGWQRSWGWECRKHVFPQEAPYSLKYHNGKKKKTPLTFSSQNPLTWSQIFKLNHVMSWKLYFNQLIVSFSFMDWAHSNFKNSTLRHLNCNFSRTPYQVNKLFLISGKHFMTL